MFYHEFGELLGLDQHPRKIKNAEQDQSNYHSYEDHHWEQLEPVIPSVREFSNFGL